MRGGRSGRGGGPAQDAARTKLAQEGYTRTENVALGQRVERGRLVPNMVDGVKRHPDGRREYLEVDTVGQDGLPTSRLRNKLKEEIKALKKGEELVYADKENPSLRIVYRYGESPSVVDTRKAEKVKPANPGSKGST